MNEQEPTIYPLVPRVDSFEMIEVDCTPLLSEEQKNWPVVSLQPRIDSYEQTEIAIEGGHGEIGIRVSVPFDAAPDETAAIIQRLRAAADDIRSSTGGRFVPTIDLPTSSTG